MSAPFLWIILPIILSAGLAGIRPRKANSWIALVVALILTITSWILPIDSIISLGGWSFKLAPSFSILGRSLTLEDGDRALLALIYGSLSAWFAVIPSIRRSRRLSSLGLAVAALLIAALAVKPFLYAALLIEMAVLLSIPLLIAPGSRRIKGAIRFLIFQTLGMPFILFSGWLLAGIEANPGDLELVRQASILVGIGFAFLLAVFPFYSWIPLLVEESPPFSAGLILWLFPTAVLFFGMGFLDQYPWLRDAQALNSTFLLVGTLMVVSGGFLALFQKHLGRVIGYAVILETGLSILAVPAQGMTGSDLFNLLLVPRVLALLLGSYSLEIIGKYTRDLDLDKVGGLGRKFPLATAAYTASLLVFSGLPLLAGFPSHLAVLQGLAGISTSTALWVLAGCLFFFISAVRILFIFQASHEGAGWELNETRGQRALLVVGLATMLILGLFPQWALPVWTRLAEIFS